MFFMLRVIYGLKKALVPLYPSHIFRRTCAFSFNAYRIGLVDLVG